MTRARMSLACFLVCSACTVGNIPDPGPADDTVSEAPDADPGSSAACDPAVAGVGSGHHNPGLACISCHAGTAGPDFTVAGTLYDSANGTAPLAGATITITDADGVDHTIVTQTNGNFYSAEPMTMPLTIHASRCPDAATMPINAGVGECNSCHGAASRIHLP
jgi:hypothetical protein